MFNANPLLKEETFRSSADSYEHTDVMTVQGTAIKTGILLAILTVAGAITWQLTYKYASSANPNAIADIMPYMMGGLIGGLLIGFATMFFKKAAPITAPIYAVFEGLFLGALSALVNIKYPGIAIQAVGATLGVLAVMLALYSTRIIPVTNKFIVGVSAATGGLMLFYLVAFILGFFGVDIPILNMNNGSPLSIAFSGIVVVLAALNLVLDFHMIERCSQTGAKKYMEWFGAFVLLVTIVWLYIEILRLLAKLRNR
ncbi:Bax inhibitor 1 like protein [Poriferisphaera corsica]|uniref:Bax inhibitor 1 like protein n=1 Tax=Poriferisphaera corsica TaxID=2528020 RepID=A0A517YPX2_9BACT|nr:Bax inhibitor-1/YccA family protein [Poriferisphaera corsica]QDU32258.1 Bax inhibitor 1 like protein [Poriferisphaera corsica]